MRTKRWSQGLLIAAAAVSLWGRAAASPQATLEQSVRKLQFSATPACDLPEEDGHMFPVPTKRRTGNGYLVGFYGRQDKPHGQIYEPRLAVLMPAAGGKPSCVKIASKLPKPKSFLTPPQPLGYGYSEEARAAVTPARKSHVYELTERVAALYFSDSADADKVIEEYFDEFEFLRERNLAPYYYDLNPNFWKWVKTRIGRTLDPTKK